MIKYIFPSLVGLFFATQNPALASDLDLAKELCADKGLIPKTESFGDCVIQEIKESRIRKHYDQNISKQLIQKESNARSQFGSDLMVNMAVGAAAVAVTPGIVEGVNNLSSNPPPASTPNYTVNCSPPSVIDLQNYGVHPTPQAIGNVSGGIR